VGAKLDSEESIKADQVHYLQWFKQMITILSMMQISVDMLDELDDDELDDEEEDDNENVKAELMKRERGS